MTRYGNIPVGLMLSRYRSTRATCCGKRLLAGCAFRAYPRRPDMQRGGDVVADYRRCCLLCLWRRIADPNGPVAVEISGGALGSAGNALPARCSHGLRFLPCRTSDWQCHGAGGGNRSWRSIAAGGTENSPIALYLRLARILSQLFGKGVSDPAL